MSFPTLPNRKVSKALKWEKYKYQDVIPMWIADTEFQCAQPILDKLRNRVEQGTLGYTLPSDYTPATDAIITWCNRRYGWTIEPEWIVWTPGVVPAFNLACKAFAQTKSNHPRVLVQKPNYPPLLQTARFNGCERVEIDSVLNNGRWTLDFEALAEEASHPESHLMILCNPMNPMGTVFTQQELDRVADICCEHNVLLCSDEIHCDLILNPQAKHIPASAHPRLENKSITLMAASKTFNVAGLGTSFAIIPDEEIRHQFNHAARGIMPWVNVLGLEATASAFTECDHWYDEQLDYLRANQEIVLAAVNDMPGLKTHRSDATFLAWIDASGLGVDDVQQWAESKGVGPSPGRDFGWPDYFRLNFGCGQDMLEQALRRLEV